MNNRTWILTTLLSTSLMLGLPAITQAAAGNDNRGVVRDSNGQLVVSTNGNCVRTRWITEKDGCGVARVAPPVRHAVGRHQISEEERTVYFAFNKTGLMQSEKNKLDNLTKALKSNDSIVGVTVVGYADRIGTASYNERLSKQRVSVVEKYLRQRGYLKTTTANTSWLGESAPITKCADKLGRSALISCLQNDRRVTVEIRYEND